MAYHVGLSQRIREKISDHSGIDEKKMFISLTFMLNGNMCLGVIKDELMIRVGQKQYDQVLTMPLTRETDFSGKPLRGSVFSGNIELDVNQGLNKWRDQACSMSCLSHRSGCNFYSEQSEVIYK